jgi:hypothetical protein
MEYLALLTGYRMLLIAVALLYGLAWLFATRWRRLADVELASGGEEWSGDDGEWSREPASAS